MLRNWKYLVIGLAIATIVFMWIDGSIRTFTGYALIAATYWAVWTLSREVKPRRGRENVAP